MKQVALSLFTIVVVVAAVAGATTAVFSDSKEIANNAVATGTLKLTLNKTAGKPWLVSGMKPGDVTGWEHMDIFNAPYPPVAGQLPFEAYFRLEGPSSGAVALYNALEIDLQDSGWNSVCGDGDDVSIGTWTLPGITGSTNRTQVSDDDPNSSGPGGDNIMPGNSQSLCQRLRLPLSADNTLQGLAVTFSEWVDAEQDND